ncbi:MAG: ubiquinone/menaquinone biosynthesis methyltransferase [candidate division Zixibacteria bacterium]|nr:ubiquinone/menaquinone biosynthesis methyltransferase [candidate division Zixibacteria bacterium]
MKQGIKKIFSEVPQTYELINHILTFGLDIYWRRKTARLAAEDGGSMWMDVCTGTGEMALYLSRLAPEGTRIYAADFSLPMLRKAQERKETARINFIRTDIDNLPFPDNTFDLVTISFAVRNLNLNPERFLQSLKAIYRVLKPGGRFVSLETSQPESKIIRRLFHFYIRLTVRSIGYLISDSKSAYTYLSQTIPRFYTAEEYADIIRQAGFSKVTLKRMFFGATAIHKAVK